MAHKMLSNMPIWISIYALLWKILKKFGLKSVTFSNTVMNELLSNRRKVYFSHRRQNKQEKTPQAKFLDEPYFW